MLVLGTPEIAPAQTTYYFGVGGRITVYPTMGTSPPGWEACVTMGVCLTTAFGIAACSNRWMWQTLLAVVALLLGICMLYAKPEVTNFIATQFTQHPHSAYWFESELLRYARITAVTAVSGVFMGFLAWCIRCITLLFES